MNYPKMLYKGNQEKYQTVIADDGDHEAELVADGWANYDELPEHELNIADGVSTGAGAASGGAFDSSSLVPVEQFDALASKVVELEEENAQLKEVIEKGSAENKGLQDQVSELQDLVQKAFVESVDFQEQIAALNASIQNPEGTTSNPEPKLISLNDLTLTQLQEMAKSKGVEFKVRDSKGTLIELLMAYQDKELLNANSN